VLPAELMMTATLPVLASTVHSASSRPKNRVGHARFVQLELRIMTPTQVRHAWLVILANTLRPKPRPVSTVRLVKPIQMSSRRQNVSNVMLVPILLALKQRQWPGRCLASTQTLQALMRLK
jgi:hypothetical protein